MGSPTRTAFMAAVSFSRKASYTGASTMKRLAQMQLWPAFMVRATAAVLAAAVEVGVGQHDERVGAAQLHDRRLERLAGRGGHLRGRPARCR